MFETWEGLRLESRQGAVLDPLKHGSSGLVTRTGGILSGPIPLMLRTLSLFGSRKRFILTSPLGCSLGSRRLFDYEDRVDSRRTCVCAKLEASPRDR